jgi:murein DD-endopeptidase MepM/ murein hydrolase activator NlpD
MSVRTASRAVGRIALVSLTLLIAPPGPWQQVSAGQEAEAADRFASLRRSQAALQASLRYHDAVVGAIRRDLAATRRRIRAAEHAARVVHARQADVRAQLRIARERLDEALADDVTDTGPLEGRVRRLERSLRGLDGVARRIERNRRSMAHRVTALRRRAAAVAGSRSSTEALLAARIEESTRLAQARASDILAARPTIDGDRVVRPVPGRVTQPYGCTGFRLEPRRGACPHFHDGLDLRGRYGGPVRAAAAGVVAYVGWSPHGRAGRAFVVVISHADGFRTGYAHLLPIARVRAGRFVTAGQTIGLVGDTGRTTGAHLHVEVMRGSATLDPLAVIARGSLRKSDREPAPDPPRDATPEPSPEPAPEPGAATPRDPSVLAALADAGPSAPDARGGPEPVNGPDRDTDGTCDPSTPTSGAVAWPCASMSLPDRGSTHWSRPHGASFACTRQTPPPSTCRPGPD